MTQVDAALAAGYSEKTAYDKAYRIERSVKVGMDIAFERAGITNKYLVEYAKKGLEATKRYGKDGDVEDKDWATAHKFFESICKLTGRLKEKDIAIDLSQHKHLTMIIETTNDETTDDNRRTSPIQIDTQTEQSV